MKSIVVASLLLVMLWVGVGSVQAQTSAQYISEVTNTLPTGTLSDTKLDAGNDHVITISWDGTGLTGNWISSQSWILHGDGDWQSLETERVGLTLRQFVEGGTLNFQVNLFNRLWLKTGGSGDFGFPVDEASGTTASGPIGGNATGTDTAAAQLALTAAGNFGWEPAINPTGEVIQLKFSTTLADHGKFICLDTISQPIGAWEWVSGATVVDATWDNGLGDDGTRCWEITDPNAPDPSNLVLSEDTLFFAATVGDPNPPAQSFDITSDNDPLNFTLTESASWLLKNPSNGTTPANILVSVNLTGQSAGVLFDSIEVASAGADNSPQYVYVQLDLAEPPPTIGVSQTSYLFNALAGGSNPPDQFLIVSNEGESTLNWTVSNNESWLQLTPGSGSDSGQVTLSVDITGLSFGDYFDVITVTDPTATNNPVMINVQLSVASDLPLIEVDKTHLYYVQPLADGHFVTRSFEVRNGGGGVLGYTATFASGPNSTIDSVVPSGGTAPESLDVFFSLNPIGNGVMTNDTVIISSVSALNSPVKVVITHRQAFDPAIIEVSQDTISLTVYECSQGYGNGLPSASFTVSNAGGDDPMQITASASGPYFFSPDPLPQVAPYEYTINAKMAAVPLGTYYDTITVNSNFALNNPQQVIVEYNLIAGTETPEIIVDPAGPITLAWQEESGPVVVPGVDIYNAFGGCMPWEFIEGEAWYDAQTTTGDVPGSTDLLLTPDGLTLGTYNSSFAVSSAGASNDPLIVDVALNVWRYRGDMNWNGELTIQDVALMVDYLFNGGTPPQPVLEVGDTNCDDARNMADVIALTESLFVTLAPICTNP